MFQNDRIHFNLHMKEIQCSSVWCEVWVMCRHKTCASIGLCEIKTKCDFIKTNNSIEELYLQNVQLLQCRSGDGTQHFISKQLNHMNIVPIDRLDIENIQQIIHNDDVDICLLQFQSRLQRLRLQFHTPYHKSTNR